MPHPALTIQAEFAPLPGINQPGPHQRYRHPRVALQERELGPLAPHDLRLEMLYAGVCGTDLHLIQQNPVTGYIRTSSPTLIPPEGRIFGHEGIGRVLEVGAEVRGFKRGAIVALESLVVCGTCDRCQKGHPNQCRHARLIGMEQDGLFANVSDIPASVAHDVSAIVKSDRDLQSLACLEPAAVAWVGCRKARLAAGEHCVIFGAGPIGLYTAILARSLFRVASVHVIEPAAFRRNLAARWANSVSAPDDFFAGPPSDLDVVIEASGCMANIDRCLPHMNADGRIVALGRSGEPLVITGVDHLITNAVSISGSRGHLGGAFTTLLDLYARDLFHPAEIITRVADGLEALASLLGNPHQLAEHEGKVLVKFPAAANIHPFPSRS